MEDRLASVKAAVHSESFQRVLLDWESERTLLRSQLLGFWKDPEARRALTLLLEDEKSNEVRDAMLITAFEDVAVDEVSDIIDVACPELASLETLLAEPRLVVALMDALANGKEHASEAIPRVVLDGAGGRALKLARSCLLLKFGAGLTLLFTGMLEHSEQDEPGELADDRDDESAGAPTEDA